MVFYHPGQRVAALQRMARAGEWKKLLRSAYCAARLRSGLRSWKPECHRKGEILGVDGGLIQVSLVAL